MATDVYALLSGFGLDHADVVRQLATHGAVRQLAPRSLAHLEEDG